jgi:hypothetical protein
MYYFLLLIHLSTWLDVKCTEVKKWFSELKQGGGGENKQWKSSVFRGRLNIVKANKGREKNISKIYEKCRKKFL